MPKQKRRRLSNLSLELLPGESLVAGRLHEGRLEIVRVIGDVKKRPWASVTKLATALAVMVAVAEGTLDLEATVLDNGATVADLLAHCSGVATGFLDVGTDSYEPIVPPRTRRIYSNLGYELLASLVAQESGLDYETYLREAVLIPAGLKDAPFVPRRGYLGGATGLVGDVCDLGRLARLLWEPVVCDQVLLAKMRSVHVPGLAGVLPGFGLMTDNVWGLGPELKGSKQPHWMPSTLSGSAYGHFGQSGSFLWFDPEISIFTGYVGPQDFGDWSKVRWPLIGEQIIELLSR